jgi:hypothetical protein
VRAGSVEVAPGQPLIVDRSPYRELVKQAIARTCHGARSPRVRTSRRKAGAAPRRGGAAGRSVGGGASRGEARDPGDRRNGYGVKPRSRASDCSLSGW